MRTKLKGTPPWLKHPALVLLWKRDNADHQKWTCKYFLAIPRDHCDCRSVGGCVRKELGTTNCRMGRVGWTPLTENAHEIYTPFRDGLHIVWDAETLKLPAYVVALGHIQELEPKKFRGSSV